jgi:hypothetical protein
MNSSYVYVKRESNNIQPGPIDTDLNPAAGDWAIPQKANTALDRYGHVEEVAALVAFAPVRSPRTLPERISLLMAGRMPESEEREVRDSDLGPLHEDCFVHARTARLAQPFFFRSVFSRQASR